MSQLSAIRDMIYVGCDAFNKVRALSNIYIYIYIYITQGSNFVLRTTICTKFKTPVRPRLFEPKKGDLK
jgi:hypothetical protein